VLASEGADVGGQLGGVRAPGARAVKEFCHFEETDTVMSAPQGVNVGDA
jgi:hypothetical protein